MERGRSFLRGRSRTGPQTAPEMAEILTHGPTLLRYLSHIAAYQPDIPRNELLTEFIAVKCNPDPILLGLLSALGTGFDCASVEEIRRVLSLGVAPSRIIFANPCKSIASIRFAKESGVYKTTFDNADELDKIRSVMPEAQLTLRVYACDETALINFGGKFGAPRGATLGLLRRACALGLHVEGVSFHVGE